VVLDLGDTRYRQLASYFGDYLYPGAPAQAVRVTAKSPANWQPFERFTARAALPRTYSVTGGYA
jgi:hypothetical protein